MPTLLIYGLMALAALGAIGGFVAYERKAGADSVRAELQPRLDTCNANVKAQNDALETLRAEGAKKQAAASAALAKAEGKARVWTDQATRLQAVLAGRKPTDSTDCKAAWQEIRK